FYLPAAAGSVPGPVFPTQRRAAPPVGGTGRILVMDDEPQVRQVLSDALLALGYDPLATNDGAEAIAAWREARAAGNPFDALVMDLTVPGGMGGAEAFERIRAEDPDARAIVSSGYSNDPVVADPRLVGFSGVLPKPWELTDLDGVLMQVLGRGSPAPDMEFTGS
ncbi:MAG: response regulator, partial [Myxococcota bacterium]